MALYPSGLRFTVFFLLLFAAALSAPPSFATREPRPIQVDHRVRTVMYQPDSVVKFTGHYGFQSSIEFAEGETIETISMGDSTGWMVNPLENILFLKPIQQDATTNVTIITNERTYLMELHAREASGIDDPEMVFVLRFIYPGDDTGVGVVRQFMDSVPVPNLEEDKDKYNFSYTISGSEEAAPIRIFDDGEFTYFQFRGKNAEVPAFFAVDAQGNESLINFRTRGDYIVVERVGPRFTLRRGNEVTCVFNEAWNPLKIGPESLERDP